MPRIHKLALNKFRGVVDLAVDLQGENFAILGPNGSGKSSTADAIDFLLCGTIRRLTGEGTSGISVEEHGAHIGSKSKDSWVEVEIESDLDGKKYLLKRTLLNPATLECGQKLPEDIKSFIALAQQSGHHMLTRREMLRFIFAPPGQRAEQVASLLQLTKIDDIRKEIQGAAREVAENLAQARAIRSNSERKILDIFDPSAKDFNEVLRRINEARKLLNADPIASVSDPKAITLGIKNLEVQSHPLQSQNIRQLVASIETWFGEAGDKFLEQTKKYRQELATLTADREKIDSYHSKKLLDIGLTLLNDNACPLCLKEWDKEELRSLLSSRLEEATITSEEFKKLEEQRQALISELEIALRSIDSLKGYLIDNKENLKIETLSKQSENKKGYLLYLLPRAFEDKQPSDAEIRSVTTQLKDPLAIEEIRSLSQTATSLPNLSGIQKARDELINTQRELIDFYQNVAVEVQAAASSNQLALTSSLFVQARDEILQDIYNKIVNRFNEFYRCIHGEDEKAFTAELNPTKTGLVLKVGFYEKGAFPPAALHSEGHQDTMGLCLFLALAEHLANGQMPILILDDVLMSVDIDHRRRVVDLIRNILNKSQYVITTHDRMWWRQLKAYGVVKSKNALEFNSWELETGPILISDAANVLRLSEKALEDREIPTAALALRRTVESLFSEVCHSLRGSVKFRSDGAWEAGELIDSSKAALSKAIKTAKCAARSWGQDLAPIEAFANFADEGWIVNPHIHYNDWANAGYDEFKPVLEAYKKLIKLYHCPHCESLLFLNMADREETELRCSCSKTNFNLKEKPKSKDVKPQS